MGGTQAVQDVIGEMAAAMEEHRRALTTEPPDALAWRSVPPGGSGG